MTKDIIIEQPDTPMSVLALFSTSKDSIQLFANMVIDEVKEGRADALRVRALCDSMEKIAETIKTNTRDEQIRAAGLHSEDKPFEAHGCIMHLTATKTEYDYSACADEVYDRLMSIKKNLDAQIKSRQEWLKTMGSPQILVDEATGSQYTAYPPVKKTQMGVKVAIK
jgi:hypothetical protein